MRDPAMVLSSCVATALAVVDTWEINQGKEDLCLFLSDTEESINENVNSGTYNFKNNKRNLNLMV